MQRGRLLISTTALGNAAESQALAYLQAQGLLLVQRNFRCRSGELDLIMRDAETLVFVEVRSRRSVQYGSPAESVTPAKQRKLLSAAAAYLQRQALDLPCRFDVVAILKSKSAPQLHIEWIKDAFGTFE